MLFLINGCQCQYIELSFAEGETYQSFFFDKSGGATNFDDVKLECAKFSGSLAAVHTGGRRNALLKLIKKSSCGSKYLVACS